jgi:hypothetical protein
MQSTETEDRWYVDVGGSPKMMTLDELVEAFENGVITAQTLVTEVGGTEWKPLKEVADLGEEEEAPPPSLKAPPVLPAPPMARVSTAPVSAFPPVASRESAWPAAAAWSQAPLPSRPSAVPSSVGPVSTAPVVQDLSLDLDDMPFQKRRSKLPMIAAAAVVVLGGLGFAASKMSVAAPAAVPVPAAQPIEFQKTVVTPIPVTPPAAPAVETASTETKPTGLSDDVKEKLLSADKEREAKKKTAKKTSRARGATRSKSSSGSSGVFRAGGDASDPLNSKL